MAEIAVFLPFFVEKKNFIYGDHKQLGSRVENKPAEALGLADSALEKLSSIAANKTMLIENYRNQREILKIFSNLFYIIPS